MIHSINIPQINKFITHTHFFMYQYQGLYWGFTKKPPGFGVKPVEKPTPNLIQFQFVMPAIIKDFFMFTASNDQ